jgi:hypothetical protein
MYWTVRGIQEFQAMFGRKPFDLPEFARHSKEEIDVALSEAFMKATVHFGEGRMNPSTIASIFALTEEKLLGHRVELTPNRSNARAFFEIISRSNS